MELLLVKPHTEAFFFSTAVLLVYRLCTWAVYFFFDFQFIYLLKKKKKNCGLDFAYPQMCDEYNKVQIPSPSPIVNIKLQNEGSCHNVYIKHNGTMFLIFGECLPTQLRQRNIRLVTFSSSTH